MEAMDVSARAAPPPAPGRARGRLVLVVKLILAAGLIAWLATGDRFAWGALRGLATREALGLLGLAGLLVVGSQVVAALRWQLLSRPAALELPLPAMFVVNYVGLLFNNFLLGGQGGDLVRLGLVFRAFPARKAEAAAILVLDRVIGVAGLCGASALLTLACWAGLTPLARWGGAVVILGGMALVALLWIAMAVPVAELAPLRPLFARVPAAAVALRQVASLRARKLLLLGGLALSIACHTLCLSAVVCCAAALRIETHPAGVMWATALIMCVNLVPATPGNLGVAEVVSQEVFGLLGSASGASLFAVYRVLGVAVCLPALLLLFLDVAGVRSRTEPVGAAAPLPGEPVSVAA